jgi:4-hydroxy-4-methyl-2-oxoglutarate aldolase
MIENAPTIQYGETSRRPRPEQVAALTGVATGNLVDALGGAGAMDYRVKPVIPEQAAFCGPALTCDNGPADNLAVFAALESVRPGDVIVAACSGYVGCAVTGDLLLGMARNNGAAAFVTDGCVRDIPGIRQVAIPCFAIGVTPNSPAREGPATVGMPVVVAGVPVATGDIVAGDQDGVVVIPFDRVDACIERLARVRVAEADLEAKVKAGLRSLPMKR